MLKLSDDPEVLEVHVVPSEEVRIVPLSPTATNNSLEEVVLSVVVLSVLVDPSSLLLQEMIVRLIRNVEKMISRFFTWFPIYWFRRTQYITSFGLFYKNEGRLLGGCPTCVVEIVWE